MNSKKIGIIGINGRFGQHLKLLLEHLGYEVIGSDIETELSNEDIVQEAEVVIFSVPIDKTVEIINGLVPFSRSDQLWMDLTTIKTPAILAMLKSKAEVTGLHPLFAPPKELTWRGKRVVICPMRLRSWSNWFYSFLRATEADFSTFDPGFHDKLMLVEQNLIHMSVLMEAAVINRLMVDPRYLFELATPLSRLHFASIGRILSQDPRLYADIQMCNSSSMEMIDECISALTELRQIVKAGDKGAFVALFEKLREYLKTHNFFEKAKEVFEIHAKK